MPDFIAPKQYWITFRNAREATKVDGDRVRYVPEGVRIKRWDHQDSVTLFPWHSIDRIEEVY